MSKYHPRTTTPSFRPPLSSHLYPPNTYFRMSPWVFHPLVSHTSLALLSSLGIETVLACLGARSLPHCVPSLSVCVGHFVRHTRQDVSRMTGVFSQHPGGRTGDGHRGW